MKKLIALALSLVTILSLSACGGKIIPITWTCSSVFFLIYFLKADWIHNFDRLEAQGKTA